MSNMYVYTCRVRWKRRKQQSTSQGVWVVGRSRLPCWLPQTMVTERSILRTSLRTSPTAEYEDELSGMRYCCCYIFNIHTSTSSTPPPSIYCPSHIFLIICALKIGVEILLAFCCDGGSCGRRPTRRSSTVGLRACDPSRQTLTLPASSCPSI